MNEIMNISGIECYEENGTAFLKLETVARGLGFTRTANSGNEVVMWSRVEKYLDDLGVHTSAHDGFIPENVFYRLAMKAKNDVAEAFQAKIADVVIPSIRKNGGYIAGQETLSDEALMAKALIVAQNTINNQKAKIAGLEVKVAIAEPKAEYFDGLVDRNLLTSLRVTAKELKVKERKFINFLIDKKFLYRNKGGQLMPCATKNDGLFEIKEYFNKKTDFKGVQTLVTPKGRETFRLLCESIQED